MATALSKRLCRASHPWASMLLAVSTLAIVSNAKAQPSEGARSWQAGAHAGWWDVGVDVLSPQGLFAGLGVPWVPMTPLMTYSGRQGSIAADARLGYGHPLSERTTLYADLLVAWNREWGDPCGCGDVEITHRLWFLPGLGVRHHLGGNTGWHIGADIPLIVVAINHSNNALGWHFKNIPFWLGPVFSQVYVGYDWSL